MNEKIRAFIQAAEAQPELSAQVRAIYGEVAALVAERLSALSQATPHPVSPEDMLGGALGDDHMADVSGGAGGLDFLKNFSHQVETIRRIQAGEVD